MKKPLRIAQVTGLHESVPPLNKAGLEQLVYYLTEELTARGHRITLFATGDSKTSAKLVPIWPRAITRDPYGQILPESTYTTWAVAEAYLRADSFDIIHNHTSWVAAHFSGLINTPVITTLHHPIPPRSHFFDQYPKEYLSYFAKYEAAHFKDHLVAISSNQATHLERPATIIHNGIPMREWNTFTEQPDNYFAFLGYISGTKGVHTAIEAILKTNQLLRIAGPVDEYDTDSVTYFRENVAPHLDSPQIEYIGPLGHEDKKEFLRHAKATLMPVQWDEPFGLVAIESLACGTPVIANNRGALPEIIEDGVSGFIVNSVDELADAINNVGALDRLMARTRYENYFTAEKMVDQYEQLYYNLAERQE